MSAIVAPLQWVAKQEKSTYILVRDNLDILNVTSRLEDLAQDILGDSLVQSTNIERSLIRFGRSSSEAGTGRRHHGPVGRGDGAGDRVVVLGDVQRRQVRLAILGGSARLSGSGSSVGHC